MLSFYVVEYMSSNSQHLCNMDMSRLSYRAAICWALFPLYAPRCLMYAATNHIHISDGVGHIYPAPLEFCMQRKLKDVLQDAPRLEWHEGYASETQNYGQTKAWLRFETLL